MERGHTPGVKTGDQPVLLDGPDAVGAGDWVEGLGADGQRRLRRVRRVGLICGI